MNYFNNVFTLFGLESGNYFAVYGGIRKLKDFISNNLIFCVPKMNKGIKGLERHEAE